MPVPANPIPHGYHAVTPYLICQDAAGAIEFYKNAFGATESMRIPGNKGRIGHAEIRIADSTIMLADESPENGRAQPCNAGAVRP